MADWHQALILVIETNSQNVSDTDFACYFHRAQPVANSLPYFCCRVWAWPPLVSSLSSHVIGIRTSWRVNPSPSSSNSSTPPTVSSCLSLLHRLIHWFVIPSCRSAGHFDYWLLWKWALFCCWLLKTVVVINICDLYIRMDLNSRKQTLQFCILKASTDEALNACCWSNLEGVAAKFRASWGINL